MQALAGVIDGEIDPAKVERVPQTPGETKSLVREAITDTAGDTLSLLGTTSDGSQLLLFHLAKLVTGLAAAQSLEDMRTAAAEFEPTASAFLANVDSGAVKLPFQLKGEATVMAEIETRATAVTEALQAGAP